MSKADVLPDPSPLPPDSSERIYFPELDGLRFIAFMMVYLFHGGVPQGIVARLIGSRAAASLRENGGFGVQLFFILSGYLIATLLLREEARFGRIDLRAFWIRRILRIWPLYYLVLVIGFGLIPLLRGTVRTPDYRDMLRKHLLPFLALHGQLVDGPDRPPARLAEHSLERLRRRAVLPDRAALDRARLTPVSAAAGRLPDRRGHRRALVLRPKICVGPHDRVQHVRAVRHAPFRRAAGALPGMGSRPTPIDALAALASVAVLPGRRLAVQPASSGTRAPSGIAPGITSGSGCADWAS